MRHPGLLFPLFGILLLTFCSPAPAQEPATQEPATREPQTSTDPTTPLPDGDLPADPTAEGLPEDPTEEGPWQPVFQRLEEALGEELMSDSAALWLWTAEGPAVERYFGRYRPESLVPIATATAWLSAATVLALVDDGLLDLDDPMLKFFPDSREDKAGITLRQLLAHTSGLPSQHRCLAEPDSSLEICAGEILGAPLRSRPGTEFRYGRASLQVAGRIAEIASGQPWSELFQRRIANPLGLTDTDFGDVPNPVIASGARSTARDYGRFLLMLLGRGTLEERAVLSEAAVATLEDPQTSQDAQVAYSPYDDGLQHGLGCWIEDAGDEERSISCPGTFGFTPWIEPARGIAGVFLVVTRQRVAQPLVRELRGRIHAEQDGTDAPDDATAEAAG